jgi:glutaminyl-peptide cyclotransferase
MSRRRSSPPRARRRWPLLLAAAGIAATLAIYLRAGSGGPGAAAEDAAPAYGYQVVRTYPHDPGAFTQGLIYRDGYLYESTGLNGQSTLRKVQLETGTVVQQIAVDDQYFAEGLTDWGDELVQLTWQAHLGFVYGRAAFDRRRTFRYGGEGWGLTHDQSRLILSDGSASLRFLDPDTFEQTGQLEVTDAGAPVVNLNELEIVKGVVYANVWQTDDIVMIALASGHVIGRIDLAGLRPPASAEHPIDVLNGIAYDASADRLFVTGKFWPALYEIRVGPK